MKKKLYIKLHVIRTEKETGHKWCVILIVTCWIINCMKMEWEMGKKV